MRLMRTISWIVLTLLLAFCPATASADTLLYTFTDHNDNALSPLHQFDNGVGFTLTFTLDEHGAGCSPGGFVNFFICTGVPVTSSLPGIVPSGSGVVFPAPGQNNISWNYPNLHFYDAGQLYSGPLTSPTFLVGSFAGKDDYESNMDLVVTDISQPTQTPEPGSLALMASGLVGLAGAIRRRR